MHRIKAEAAKLLTQDSEIYEFVHVIISQGTAFHEDAEPFEFSS